MGWIALNVSLMNEKVTFQKNVVVTDAIGNHKNDWEDFYTFHATIGGEGMAKSKEKEAAGTIVENVGMTVTIRYCQKASEIGSTTHNIFRDEIYVITNVDHMNFKKKCLKFSCRKVRKKLECENDFGDINSDDGYGAFQDTVSAGASVGVSTCTEAGWQDKGISSY